jgi:hypothetical protein
VIEHPANRDIVNICAFDAEPTSRRVNTSMTTATGVTAKEDEFAAEQVNAPAAVAEVNRNNLLGHHS